MSSVGISSYDPFYDRAGPPTIEFAFLPKTCAISGKRIWYCGKH